MKKFSDFDLKLIARIKELKSIHPFFGYRRIWAVLRFRDNIVVNKKKVYRLMKISDLLIERNKLLRAKRTKTRDKPKPEIPNHWWGIDMTKIRLDQFGYIYITIVIDWCSKKLIGYHIGERSKSKHWQNALDMAVNNQFPNGVKDEVERRGYNLNLMADNGCQPTSKSFTQNCKDLGINLAFTSYNNPKGNADTERFMRTMKEECLWINEFDNIDNLTKNLKNWFLEYNQNYLHSTLHYKSPVDFESEFYKKIENSNEKLIINSLSFN